MTYIVAYSEDNTAAFKQLYSHYKQSLFRFMTNGCHNEASTLGLYQDIWLRAIKGRENYETNTPINPWLFRISRNRLVDDYHQQTTTIGRSNASTSVSESATLATPLTPAESALLKQTSLRSSQDFKHLRRYRSDTSNGRPATLTAQQNHTQYRYFVAQLKVGLGIVVSCITVGTNRLRLNNIHSFARNTLTSTHIYNTSTDTLYDSQK